MNHYGNDLFKGASRYYSKFRPPYPASLIRYLVKSFSLDGSQNLLDLGCGTGQLTIRFADWCNKIIAIDKEREMLEEAKRIHGEMRTGDIHWYYGDLDQFKNESVETFQLVIMAKSFHCMNRPLVLEQLYGMVTNGGGIAVIDNYEPGKKLEPWQIVMNEVIEKWYGGERKAGSKTYSHPTESHEEVIAQSKFKLNIVNLPPYEVEWTVQSILGHHYSTSYESRRFLGDDVEPFEKDMTDALSGMSESGVFKEKMNLTIKLGIKAANM